MSIIYRRVHDAPRMNVKATVTRLMYSAGAALSLGRAPLAAMAGKVVAKPSVGLGPPEMVAVGAFPSAT